MKTKQNNDMIDHIDLFYAKTEIELLWLILLGAVCEKN